MNFRSANMELSITEANARLLCDAHQQANDKAQISSEAR